MSEDTKQMWIGLTAAIAIVGMVAFGLVKCESQKHETLRQCLQTSRPALECSAIVRGMGR
jgi:flagellar biogenesis protein FliO